MSGVVWPTCIDNLASREWEIDQRVRVLIGKFVARTATRDDENEFHILQRERVRLMMPKLPRRS